MNHPDLTPLLAVCKEHNVPEEAAKELARNWLSTEPLDDDRPVRTLTEMIDHRRYHWPLIWQWEGISRDLACAMVRCLKEDNGR